MFHVKRVASVIYNFSERVTINRKFRQYESVFRPTFKETPIRKEKVRKGQRATSRRRQWLHSPCAF